MLYKPANKMAHLSRAELKSLPLTVFWYYAEVINEVGISRVSTGAG